MRRIYILEQVGGLWFLTVSVDSRIARLAVRCPRWLVSNVESARVGTDLDYVTIRFK